MHVVWVNLKAEVHQTQVSLGLAAMDQACFPSAQVESHPRPGSLEACWPGTERHRDVGAFSPCQAESCPSEMG